MTVATGQRTHRRARRWRLLLASAAGLALLALAGLFTIALTIRKEPVVNSQPLASRASAVNLDEPAPAGANRLAGESSPYLLQHADNPVDWFPWSDEAFTAARERGVPIFLSVGYATCYWCHVMERESFEDDATAAVLNQGFVAIKVDREERPDVDDVYMTATQLMTGSGGWPMSVFLTPPGAVSDDDPGLKPFYAGTYFPKEARLGMPSFTQALEGVSQAWQGRKQDVVQQAERVADAVRQRLASRNEPVQLPATVIEQAIDTLLRIHDDEAGGFGQAPKFPQPVYLELLLDERERLETQQAAAATARLRQIDDAVDTTMRAMALGGVFDQVGGGFHRYSTDGTWTVPHFEKMLYDQAQLLRVYARRFAQTGQPIYERVAQQTADYVLREMRSATGAYFAAQDAEVNDREGQNYLWTKKQMESALGEDDADFAIDVFELDKGPNFRDPHHPEDERASVLRLGEAPAALAEKKGMSLDAFFAKLDSVRAQLLEARMQRDQPRTDDKTIAEWAGMMIASLADASRLLGEPRLLEEAERSAAFVWETLRDDSGALRRTWRSGALGPLAGLTDYAQMARGFAAIARAKRAGETPAPQAERASAADWLGRAHALLDEAQRRFGADDGGWHDVEAERADLFIRPRTTYDGAIPSGSAVMLHALLDVHDLTDDPALLAQAEGGLAAVSAIVAQAPLAAVESVRALARLRLASADETALFPGLPPLKLGKTGDIADDLLARARDAVQIFADSESVAPAPGAPATVNIEMRIADGFHITAHEPGVEGLFGVQVNVAGGQGVRAVVHYPEGEPLDVVVEGAENAGSPLVHSQAVQIQVELIRTDEAPAGQLRLEVSYQVCTDRVCLAPVTAALGVHIEAR